jgi:hypothetical protein
VRFFFNKAQVRFCEASQVFRIGTDRFVAAPWSLARKGRQLAAFQKVELDPGENRTVELRIRPRPSRRDFVTRSAGQACDWSMQLISCVRL